MDAKNDLPVISADAEVPPLSSVSKDAQRVERYTSGENPRWKGLQNAPQVYVPSKNAGMHPPDAEKMLTRTLARLEPGTSRAFSSMHICIH